MWFLILITTAALLFYLWIRKSLNYWKDRNVPFLEPLPIFGNSAQLIFRKKSFVEHIQFLYNVYPDKRYYGSFQFTTPQLVIRDPDLIKQITVKDFDHFTDRTVLVREDAEPIFTKNLVSLKGRKWRDMRSTLSPVFTSSKMKHMFTLISDCAQQFTDYFLKQSKEMAMDVEVKDAFSRFTNDVIATTSFGIVVDSLKDKENEFFITGKDVTNFGGIRGLKFFAYSLIPSIMRFFKVRIFSASSSEFFRRIIKETIKVREEKGVVRPDMIHILLEARKGRIKDDEETHGDDEFATVNEVDIKDDTLPKPMLSDDDITAQALIFFFAGFETTSTLMSFLAYELAINPEIQSRLQEEIDNVVHHHSKKVGYDAVLGMKYLDMVISEALRKWTPGFALDRKCVKDYKISPQLPGELPVVIEKDTTIVIPISGIHHDPQYFPDPYKFDPERFSDENKSSIQPFTYMPFGSGPRNCIASRFALMETKILFFHLLREFDITPSTKLQVPIAISRKNFTMIPDNGLWLSFKQRAK